MPWLADAESSETDPIGGSVRFPTSRPQLQGVLGWNDLP
jgi:hypothetical protein